MAAGRAVDFLASSPSYHFVTDEQDNIQVLAKDTGSTLGERVTVESEWGPRSGTVVEMPFVDPSKQIPVS